MNPNETERGTNGQRREATNIVRMTTNVATSTNPYFQGANETGVRSRMDAGGHMMGDMSMT